MWSDDHRYCKPAPHSITVDDGMAERELPTKWEVCPVCQGRGTHVNPDIDAHGLTAEELREDPDFAEDYFAGAYDITCNRCRGRTTVAVVDRERCDPELLELYDEQQQELAECEAMERAERMMGA